MRKDMYQLSMFVQVTKVQIIHFISCIINNYILTWLAFNESIESNTWYDTYLQCVSLEVCNVLQKQVK